jgi:hypothetical protein
VVEVDYDVFESVRACLKSMLELLEVPLITSELLQAFESLTEVIKGFIRGLKAMPTQLAIIAGVISALIATVTTAVDQLHKFTDALKALPF